jgi:hypothetical protein
MTRRIPRVCLKMRYPPLKLATLIDVSGYFLLDLQRKPQKSPVDVLFVYILSAIRPGGCGSKLRTPQ